MRKIWNRSDIDPNANYCFVLYQSDSGLRDYGICRDENVEFVRKESDFAAVTAIVPIDIILRGDVFSIADRVKLSTGDNFFLDSDAVWYLRDEWEDLINERCPIRWFRGMPPRRKPRYA